MISPSLGRISTPSEHPGRFTPVAPEVPFLPVPPPVAFPSPPAVLLMQYFEVNAVDCSLSQALTCSLYETLKELFLEDDEGLLPDVILMPPTTRGFP